MDAPVFSVIGTVSAVAGIAGLFISLPTRQSRVVHFAYCAAIAAVSGTTIHYFAMYSSTQELEREAYYLLESPASNNDRGLMLAALALLEKNKDKFPEMYASAKQLCTSAGLTGEAAKISTTEGAHAMSALLRGLSNRFCCVP